MSQGSRVVLPDNTAGYIVGWQGEAYAVVVLDDGEYVTVAIAELRAL